MSGDQAEDDEARWKEQQRVYDLVRPLITRAERVYDRAVTSLWLGNAGAALAALSFIGAASGNEALRQQLLTPLGIFLGGIVAMGIGEMIALWQSRSRIDRMSRADSWLDIQGRDIKSPTEEIGLAFSDWRTRIALLSAGLFIAGCCVGFYQLLNVEPATVAPPEVIRPTSLWNQITAWMCSITEGSR